VKGFVKVRPKKEFRVSYPLSRSGFIQVSGSGSGLRIRIRIPDPDPGGKKIPSKIEKASNFMLSSDGCSLFGAEGCFCSLDVLYRGLEITKK
jgi:hypothetical protein